MSLVLRNLDTKNEISLNKEFPFIIGRGEISGCMDKRVSRKHGQISYVSDNELQILALHTNPCFIMKKGLPPVVQLKKNEEKILTEGDYLGLLPDASWFEIITKNESSKNLTDHQNSSISLSKINSPTPLTSNHSPLKTNSEGYCNIKETIHEEASTSSGKNSSKTETPSESRSEKGSSTSRTHDIEAGSTNVIPPELENTKKLPLWMYEIDEPKEEIPAKAKLLSKRPHSTSADEVQEKKAKVGENSSSNVHEDGEPQANEVEPGEIKVKEESVDEKSETVEVKSEFENRQEKTLNIEKSNKNESVPKNKESENSGESSKKANEKDGYESDVVEPEESNGTENPPRRRPICQYEASCYRKNPVHKQEYCHPGDTDYVRPENRPHCPYGAACYRQNQLHRVEYQHPTSTPAPRPQPQSPASPALPPPPKNKPKTTKNKTRSSSEEEDDYDVEDPFINDDSSDDYAPSESSSDEEDEDDLSRDDKENLLILKKVNKKCTGVKKK